MTVLVDVGGVHPDGANAPASKLLAYIRELSKLLSSNFPERVKRLVIFPIHRVVSGVAASVQQQLPDMLRAAGFTVEEVGDGVVQL